MNREKKDYLFLWLGSSVGSMDLGIINNPNATLDLSRPWELGVDGGKEGSAKYLNSK